MTLSKDAIKLYKNFFKRYHKLLEENNFDELYHKYQLEFGYSNASILTYLLFEAGVDPTPFFTKAIPACYAELVDSPKLTNLVISDGVESIGINFVRLCKSVRKVYIPSSVDYIGSDAFSYNVNLTITYDITKSEFNEMVKKVRFGLNWINNCRGQLILKDAKVDLNHFNYSAFIY